MSLSNGNTPKGQDKILPLHKTILYDGPKQLIQPISAIFLGVSVFLAVQFILSHGKVRKIINIMPNPTTTRPDPTEHVAEFGNYIQLVPEGDIQLFLASQLTELLHLIAGLSEKESLMHHAPFTWSIRQVVGHITDCERIFGHRALWIARNNTTPLAGFDETDFMNAVNFDRYPMGELLSEFENVRRSYLLFFRHLEPEAWLRRGTVCEHPATMRALAWLIAGHTKHHLDILHKRLGTR